MIVFLAVSAKTARTACLLALGLLLTACAGGGERAAASPTPSAHTVAVSNADSGRSITLHAGDIVEVALHQESGLSPWTDLGSNDQLVMMPVVDVRATALRGVAVGRFEALGPGSAEISAVAAPQCSPGLACPAYVRSWRLQVQVVGA